MTNKVITFCITTVVVVTLTGCSSFDGQKVRQAHVESYQKELDQRAEKEISNRIKRIDLGKRKTPE